MIKAIIIDDEALAREALADILSDVCPDVEVLARAENAKEGIKLIRQHQPQLVFLDVEMPNGNGFTVLEAFKVPTFDVVFTTAYNQYAIKAIKYAALDYLLKPIDTDDLVAAVERVRERIDKNHERQSFEALLSNLNNQNSGGDQRITLPTAKGFKVVEVNKIVRCEANSNYTEILFADGTKTIVSKTLGEYEALLSDEQFFRIHQSHLINLKHVKGYVRGRGGQVEMSDGAMVDVSRRKKDEFIERLGKGF